MKIVSWAFMASLMISCALISGCDSKRDEAEKKKEQGEKSLTQRKDFNPFGDK